MSYIKFNDGLISKSGVVTRIDEHTIRIAKCNQNLTGFKMYTDADVLIGDYSDYRYDYMNKSLDKSVYEYTDDNHKWVKPIYTTEFVASAGGKLEGTTKQIVDTYSQLNIPTPIPDENYAFVEWNPEIPKSGNITKDDIYTAVFEYVPTLEEVKQEKIEEFSTLCNSTIEAGQDILLSTGDTDHFTYKAYDQTNISNALTIVNSVKMKTGQEVSAPFYDSDNRCRIYSYKDIVTIYISEQNFITYNLTLCHQLQAMIRDMTNKEAIKNLAYSETELTGEYLETFMLMLEQAKAITDLFIGMGAQT